MNVNGEWQSFTSVGVPHGESKPGWKVLRALANTLHLPGFSYESANQIRDEIKSQVNQVECCDECKKLVDIVLPKFEKVAVKEWPMYQDNALVRRAKALQEIFCAGDN